jgi:hypothetical protein
MKVICAWCRRHLAGHPDDYHITHGICGLCFCSMVEQAADPWSLWQDEGGEA